MLWAPAAVLCTRADDAIPEQRVSIRSIAVGDDAAARPRDDDPYQYSTPEQQIMTVSEPLAAVVAAYREALGHPVPTEVVQMFALRPGPLILEIRQAIALGRPVAGWVADYRRKQHAGHTLQDSNEPMPSRHRSSAPAVSGDTHASATGTDSPRW